MANAIEQAARRLQGLRRDTIGAIGDVANEAYKSLSSQPVLYTDTDQVQTVRRHLFTPIRHTSGIMVPAGPVAIPEYKIDDIGEVRTQKTRGELALRRGVTIVLPASLQSVEIGYTRRGRSRNMRVDSNGEVTLEGSSRLTRPRVTSAVEKSMYPYADPYALKLDYTTTSKGALLGAGLLIAGLKATYDISMKPEARRIQDLLEHWEREIDDVPLELRAAELVPHSSAR